MNHDNNTDAFGRATAKWQDEVDEVAARLLGSGEAVSPGDAMSKAERIVQERRRADFNHVSDLAKRFEAGGRIIGGHGV